MRGTFLHYYLLLHHLVLISFQTQILVTHGLIHLPDCDRIIVMDDGHILESGTYDELMVKDGKLKEMMKSQTNGSSEGIPMIYLKKLSERSFVSLLQSINESYWLKYSRSQNVICNDQQDTTLCQIHFFNLYFCPSIFSIYFLKFSVQYRTIRMDLITEGMQEYN